MNADRRIDGRDVDADTIRKDHLAEVHIGLQAIYLAAVLVLLALLDAT
jgi:hypothetical protein